MRKLPAVLLALPLGELSPQVTERAHVVSPVTKVSNATRNFLTMPKSSPFGGAGIERSEMTERVRSPLNATRPSGECRTALLHLLERIDREMSIVILP